MKTTDIKLTTINDLFARKAKAGEILAAVAHLGGAISEWTEILKEHGTSLSKLAREDARGW